jgi:hypothetical protein
VAEAESARVIIEVVAGLIPGTPEPTFTRRWVITSTEWQEAETADAGAAPDHATHTALLLAFRAAEADEYARLLRNPRRFNWVRTDWIWL